MIIVNEICDTHELMPIRAVQCLSGVCRGLGIECHWFKSRLSTRNGTFLAISPLIKLLVQPDRSIVIVIAGGGWGRGPSPPPLYPPLLWGALSRQGAFRERGGTLWGGLRAQGVAVGCR